MAQYIPDPEYLGRRRFPDYKGYRKDLANRAETFREVMQNLLASNYPKDRSTNLAQLLRIYAREFARLNGSAEAISLDGVYAFSRVQYLHQILGERLFLADKIAPENYSNESYRRYLLAILSAYLQGSKVSVIENLASYFTGLDVKIRELYLEARQPNSTYGLTDTHKMVVDVFIEDILRAGYNINDLQKDLDFFINLVRPAHVLHDTRLIWTEQIDVNKIHDIIFGDTGGGCIPVYATDDMAQPSYYAQQIVVLPSATGATGRIKSIEHQDNIFYLDNGHLIVVEPEVNGTRIYDVNGHRIPLSGLNVLEWVRITALEIPGSFQFWWQPAGLITNWYDQFFPSIYKLPAFQENVKKVMDPHGRFPLQIKTTPTTICDRWVHDLLQPYYEDLRKNCNEGTERLVKTSNEFLPRMWAPRQAWTYPQSTIYDPELLGSSFVYTMLNMPLTDGSSQPASVDDVSVWYDSTYLNNVVTAVDASTGRVDLMDTSSFWDSSAGQYPHNGELLSFGYHYLLDGTNYDATNAHVFGLTRWQLQSPIVTGDGSGTLAGIADITLTVDGTTIADAVNYCRPLTGHVHIRDDSSFWTSSALGRLPQPIWDGTQWVGDIFEFQYYKGNSYRYPLIFDDLGRNFDSPGFVFDGSAAGQSIPVEDPRVIGYRYRTYLMHHSSLLNSPDTLTFNDYQKPVKRASIINREETLNHYNVVWSPEFLTDTSKVELSDAYLSNGLDPVLKLREGTPPFQKTFANKKGLAYHRKLTTIRDHRHPLLYADLLLKEFPEGESTPLSPICDNNTVKIGTRLGEDTIPAPKECSPCILFDTVDSSSVYVEIPGDYIGVPDLGIMNVHLRENLILREIEYTGLATYTYTVTTTPESITTSVFSLPASFPYDIGDQIVNFPSLPVMKNATTLADISDISVTIDGDAWPIIGLDPVNGVVQLAPFPTESKVEHQFVLSVEDAARRRITLPGNPITPDQVTLTIVHGGSQYYGTDFYVYGRYLTWWGTVLDGLLQAGDIIRVTYEVDPIVAATFVFTYKIKSSAYATLVDPYRSRVYDNGYVFSGLCPDGAKAFLQTRFSEYYTFLSDYSDGIKISYFNPITANVEDHIFSGPVFEMHESVLDEVGAPGSFPDALVRIRKTRNSNPLHALEEYSFINADLVRFRKKTFKELLPDRTFRTLKITEMMPV